MVPREDSMSDRNMIIGAVVGTGAAVGGLLVTLMLALHGTTERNTNRQIDALTDRMETRVSELRDTMDTRISDLRDTMNNRFDDLGDRVDDLAGRTSKLEDDVREIRTLLIERVLHEDEAGQ